MEQFVLNFEPKNYSKAELALLSVEDIFSIADEEMLLRLGEDRRVEHKPVTIHGGELGEYFSMWANTSGGGLIVLGQRDKKVGVGFYGCSCVTGDALNEAEKRGIYHCPDATVRSRRVPVH